MSPGSDFVAKMLILGAAGVGKTALVERYVNSFFGMDYKMTIGTDIYSKTLPDVEGLDGESRQVSLQIWDIGGEERFEFFRDAYYAASNGAFLVFDLTRRGSFEALPKWLDEFRSYISRGKVVKAPALVLGNKLDLERYREVTRQEASSWAEAQGLQYMETSAKDDIGVDKGFRILATDMVNYSLNVSE